MIMRIDKFLKVSRIIKRRTVAKELANQGRIILNNKVAKSSSPINIGDIISVQFGNKILTIKVKNIIDTTKKSDAETMYSIVNEQYKNINE